MLMKPLLAILLCAVTSTAFAQAPLLYFEDSSVAAASEQRFSAAWTSFSSLMAQKRKPSFDQEGLEHSRKMSAARNAMRDEALLGNPRGMLFMCMVAPDKLGPPAMIRDALAWCRVANQSLPEKAAVIKEEIQRILVEAQPDAARRFEMAEPEQRVQERIAEARAEMLNRSK